MTQLISITRFSNSRSRGGSLDGESQSWYVLQGSKKIIIYAVKTWDDANET